MTNTGTTLGPKFDPYLVETESSGQKCVKLDAAGQFVEFAAQSPANAMVVRYSLPDAPDGDGVNSTISLFQNGKFVQKLTITSRYSWLYGKYPFTNDPKAGKPRNFYDEVRLKDLSIARGDMLRLQKDYDDRASYCIIDLVDLENVAPPLTAPTDSLSVVDFGATGNGEADDTAALKNCVAAAKQQGKSVWVPAGNFKITGDLKIPDGVTVQGAGMWRTTFVGDADLYTNASRRVRFVGHGSNIHLSDFAIIGKLNYRNDREDNDGIGGTFGVNSTITRIWGEHTKTGDVGLELQQSRRGWLPFSGHRRRWNQFLRRHVPFSHPELHDAWHGRRLFCLLAGDACAAEICRPASMSSAIAPASCHFWRTARPFTAAKATALKIAGSTDIQPVAAFCSARHFPRRI